MVDVKEIEVPSEGRLATAHYGYVYAMEMIQRKDEVWLVSGSGDSDVKVSIPLMSKRLTIRSGEFLKEAVWKISATSGTRRVAYVPFADDEAIFGVRFSLWQQEIVCCLPACRTVKSWWVNALVSVSNCS